MTPAAQPAPASDVGDYNNTPIQARQDYVIIPVDELELLERHYTALLVAIWKLQNKRRKIVTLK